MAVKDASTSAAIIDCIRYGYLVVDHHPQTPEEIRFHFNVFKDEPGYIGVLQIIKQQ